MMQHKTSQKRVTGRECVLLVILLLQSLVVTAADNIPLPPLPAPTQKQGQSGGNNNQLTQQQQAEVAALMQQIEAMSQANDGNNKAKNNGRSTNNQGSLKKLSEKNKAKNSEDFDVSQFFKSPTTTFGTVFDPAFQNIIKRQFPLTPEQIKALREVFQTIQRAKVAPIEVPTPTVSTRNVLLAPGSTPPIIKMAKGYVSSIVFLDETGQPWPIANFSIGNPEAFDINWDNSSNVLMIQGMGPYETGNMAVRLVGLETPVMVTMVNDQQKVDYRVDLRVQGKGPKARSSIISGILPSKANSALLSLLDGVAPNGSEKLTIKGAPAEAWLLNDTLFLRTRLTLLSPSWSGTVSSADGMRVYQLHATPMLLASHQGQTVELKVEGL